MILNFPGGAGGNWLRKILHNEEIKRDTKNFHYKDKKLNKVKTLVTHSIDPKDFDCLYSGSYFFNFYVNVIYKHFYLEDCAFRHGEYKIKFLDCVNTARHICLFDEIKHLIFFNFDDLIFAPEAFLIQVNSLQEKIGLEQISNADFLDQRKIFFDTCVNTTNLYENFDNLVWVAFVMGQLMNVNIVPNDFVIFDVHNWDRCKQFAKENYHKCTLTQVYHFETNVQMPSLLDKY